MARRTAQQYSLKCDAATGIEFRRTQVRASPLSRQPRPIMAGPPASHRPPIDSNEPRDVHGRRVLKQADGAPPSFPLGAMVSSHFRDRTFYVGLNSAHFA